MLLKQLRVDFIFKQVNNANGRKVHVNFLLQIIKNYSNECYYNKSYKK